MALPSRQPPDIRAVIARRLDADYVATVNSTFNAIRRDTPDLSAVQERAVFLEEQGARFSPNDPALRQLRQDFENALARHRQRIDDIVIDVQEVGVTAAQELNIQKALLGLSSEQALPFRAAWNTPDPAALARVIAYAESPAFQASMDHFEQGISGMVQNIMLQGQVAGWGPLRTSGVLQQAVPSLPAHYANSLLRSMQLTSYRDATVLSNVANADILEGHMRIASLDDRCCAACIALHGTMLAINERVDDHRAGRCDSIAIVKGRPRNIQTGPEWFDSLPPERQASLAPFRSSPAKLNALREGAIKWPDLVQRGTDPVFGNVVSEASLKGILGKDAQRFYIARGGRPSVPRPPRVTPPAAPAFNTGTSAAPLSRKAIGEALKNAGYSETQINELYRDVQQYSSSFNQTVTAGPGGDRVNQALAVLPKHEGPIVRGLNYTTSGEELLTAFEKSGLSVGNILEEGSISSWSHNIDQRTNLFLHPSRYNVTYRVQQNRTGVAVENLSAFADEHEVLVPSGAQYRILNIIDKTQLDPSDPLYRPGASGRYVIELEEIF